MNKFKSWLATAKIAVAVGRTVLTGKPAKAFDKIDRGFEIADDSILLAEKVRDLLRTKK